jgi:hypothetical protein
MIRSAKQMTKFDIVATDGHVGSVDDFYFDDERWAIRYVVVDTGLWVEGRRVLGRARAPDAADSVADRVAAREPCRSGTRGC